MSSVKKYHYAIFSVCFTLLPLQNAISQQEAVFPPVSDPFIVPSARADGSGGLHVGIADDFYTALFANPAGLADVKHQFSAVTLGFTSANLDLALKLIASKNKSEELLPLISGPYSVQMSLFGPFSIGRVGEHWGIGFFNSSNLKLSWTPEDVFVLTPKATEDVMLVGGYGFRIVESASHKLDLGFTGKLLFSFGFEGTNIYMNEVKYILESLPDWQLETRMGFGLDGGVRWTIKDCFIIGVAFYDFFSPVKISKYESIDNLKMAEVIGKRWVPIQPRASFGIAWKMKSEYLHRYFTDITIAADFKGLLGNLQFPIHSPILDLSACIEICLLEVFTLRAKWSEMLPGGGLGFDFSFMKLDVAVFGKELGLSRGDAVTYGASIQISFRY